MRRLTLALVILGILPFAPAFAQTQAEQVRYSPIDCVKQAQVDLYSYSHDQLVKLCSGATSRAPIDCAVRAKNLYVFPVSSEQALKLCAGATSPTSRIECLKEAKSRLFEFEMDQLVKLCEKL